MNDLTDNPPSELLSLYADILAELRRQGILRTGNNPAGDWAEFLFREAFGWKLAPNSEKGYDATDATGIRYQIKSRRIYQRNTSRELSAIKSLNDFDVLAGVLFDEQYRVIRAAMAPVSVVEEIGKPDDKKGYRFFLRDDIWKHSDVEDVTSALRKAANRRP
ncbi:hypothetical protein [Ruegeria sp. THAF33]|uniref:hypothetical protein n=1 Tax=Ruegeria sp. THAF33 TaxID=2587853 RepID=UPI00126928F1|nr:hypothetical protein [Ruegeria sp. THAF33]QFT74873.1 hypothetical protein FIU92_17685 [Ruegeria sp. THAF33]